MKYTIVICHFQEGVQGYAYKCAINGIKTGDLVLVQARDSFSVAKVGTVLRQHTHTRTTKWVVQKIDETLPALIEAEYQKYLSMYNIQ